MTVRILVCDGCGKRRRDVECMVEFTSHGITVHLCDECIDVAKEIVDEAREGGAE